MKKLILSLAAAAIVASGFGAYKAYQSYQPKNNLLAMNLEALAQGEEREVKPIRKLIRKLRQRVRNRQRPSRVGAGMLL